MKTIALSRRSFLQWSALTAAGWLTGCATNPVTGQRQLMLVSEQQEQSMDRSYAPHQLSADYGLSQDTRLNAYLQQTGARLAALTHRPQVPYAFHAVNANYINAYAFPGGTIATTRGILLKLDNEAELAALLGHELGHVNARHTAEAMSKGMLANILVGGVAMIVASKSQYGELAGQLGMLGSGALLASYSRDNERQADALGLEYMVKSGYDAQGMVGLMDLLNSLSKGKPGAAELLFATHPMSSERYQTAVEAVNGSYRAAKGQPDHRERYMDHTAALRKIGPAVEAQQKGEEALGKKEFAQAEELFQSALKQAPEDYTGLVLMAKCQLAQKKLPEAAPYLEKARAVYPKEGQANYLQGFVLLNQKKYEEALDRFQTYDRQLPGNPTIVFFRGYAYEGLQRRDQAADAYYRYLQAVKEGSHAQHAYQRLVEWGYIKPKS